MARYIILTFWAHEGFHLVLVLSLLIRLLINNCLIRWQNHLRWRNSIPTRGNIGRLFGRPVPRSRKISTAQLQRRSKSVI
jgi:hypothetical protein